VTAVEESASDSSTAVTVARGAVYRALSIYALDPMRRESLGPSIVKRINLILAQDRANGFAFDLPTVDRVEYEFIKRELGDG
jgi:hypothetical protein